MDINGKSAIITGGASGLGAATARRFAAAGAQVAILDRDRAAGETIAAQIDGLFFDVDVADEDRVKAAVDDSVARHGPRRILVNAAGIVRDAEMLDAEMNPSSLQDFVKVVTTNLIGAYNVMRLFAAARYEPLDTGERGVIINDASVAALDAPSSLTAYTASKSGVAGITLGAARSLAPWGILVVAIAPGQFDTPILAIRGETRQQLEMQARSWVPFPPRMGDAPRFAGIGRCLPPHQLYQRRNNPHRRRWLGRLPPPAALGQALFDGRRQTRLPAAAHHQSLDLGADGSVHLPRRFAQRPER